MTQQTPRRRRLAAGVAFMVAGAFGLVAAVPASAEVEDIQHPEPELVTGNPKCEDFGLKEIKFDDPEVGETTKSSYGFEVTINLSHDKKYVSWESNKPIGLVLVKGGPNAHKYVYEPPATVGDDLVAPDNPGGQQSEISHVSFCFKKKGGPSTTTTTTGDDETTTTTVDDETTTTTVDDETTTTTVDDETTTTTVGDETTTTVGDVTTTTVKAGGGLPVTGSTALPLVIGGVILLGAGGALVASAKLRRG